MFVYRSILENAMTFQSVPRTCEIIVKGTMGGQEMINTFYGQKDTAYTLADVTSLANGVAAWATAQWKPNMPSNYHFDGVTVRGLNSSIDLEASDNSTAGNGAAAPSTLSNNASFAVSRRSAFTGRGARGRVYLPPPSSAWMVDDNHIDPALNAAIIGMFNALDTVVGGAGFVPVIVHRVAAGAPLPEAVVFTLVEWVIVNFVVDSMRRRLPGRGV